MSGIPEKSINFAVYYEGEDLLGMAEGTLPSLEALTETVKGAGIAGEFDSVTLGHFGSITQTLKWRNITNAFVKFAPHRTHDLYLYAAHQDYEPGTGLYITQKIAVFERGIPKNSNLGNLVVAGMTDTETELELTYLKLEINDRERIELDKFNYIYRVDGVDYLESVRRDLGKAG
jgi:P2 family phage contractile tail tube protein